MDQAARSVALTLLDALAAQDPLASEDEQVRAVELAFAPLEAVVDQHGTGAVIHGAYLLSFALLNMTARKYDVDALNVIAEVRDHVFGRDRDTSD